MANDYTNYPLPPNWEQRFDRETKRFFFVDHFAKITTWVDPRIELYNLDIQESDLTNESDCSSTNSVEYDQPPFNEINSRDKNIANLHQKFPNFTLVKIKECLNENFDNVSSVEFILKHELQSIEQKEKDEIRKRFEDNSNKLENVEQEKQIKDKPIFQKTTQEAKSKIKEDLKSNQTTLFTDHEIHKTGDIQKYGTNEIVLCSETNPVRSNNNEGLQKTVKNETKTDNYPDSDKVTTVESIQELKTKSNVGPNQMNYCGSNPKNHFGHNTKLLSAHRTQLAKGPNPANRIGHQSN